MLLNFYLQIQCLPSNLIVYFSGFIYKPIKCYTIFQLVHSSFFYIPNVKYIYYNIRYILLFQFNINNKYFYNIYYYSLRSSKTLVETY